jgi:hypothetical protein
VNFAPEPTNAPSGPLVFVNDPNAHLHFARATKTFTPYINFALVFPKFDSYPGYAGGLVTFVFDPTMPLTASSILSYRRPARVVRRPNHHQFADST